MFTTYLVQKLDKEIRRGYLPDGESIYKQVLQPIVYDWSRRYLVARSPEAAFATFKNETLPLFKECIRALYDLTPSTEKENMECIKTIDERINQASELEKFDKTAIIRYQFEIGNGMINLGMKKILKEHLDYGKEKSTYKLQKEIEFIKQDIGFGLSRYVNSYRRSEEAEVFPPKGVYDTSPLGQGELKFAFDEVIKLKLKKEPVLPSLDEKNYEKIGIADPQLFIQISKILETKSKRPGALRFYISTYGTKPLCYPSMCLNFLLEKDYEIVYTYLNMIGYMEISKTPVYIS